MGNFVEFYSGDKLCQSIDFLYASSMCGGDLRNRQVSQLASLNQQQRFYIASSTVSLPNISRQHFSGDLECFEGTYILDRLSDELLSALRSDRALFLIDYSGETAMIDDAVFTNFHNELTVRDIPSRNVVLISENHNLEGPYIEWCQRSGLKPIHILAYNHGLYQFSGTANINQPQDRERRLRTFNLQQEFRSARSRTFICLNNVARLHRYALAAYLNMSPHAGKGWLSCLGRIEPEYVDTFSGDVLALMGKHSVGRAGFKEFLTRLPLEADEPLATPRHILAGTLGDERMYESAFFSFVTESEFDSGTSLRVTEKVYKPMANLHPYLLFSSPHVQSLLKNDGFRSLDGVIDEGYDRIEDPLERFATLLEMVDWICTRSPAELLNLTEEARPVITHNYHWFWDAPSRYNDDAIHGKLQWLAKDNFKL
jgi:hypothetical protein